MIIIPILIMILSLIVLAGWGLDIMSLTTLGMGGVTEKAFTASMFVVSCLGVLFVRYSFANYFFASILGALCSLSLLVTDPFSAQDLPIDTVIFGVPSLGTILMFAIIVYYLLMQAAHFKSSKSLGKTIAIVCSIVIIGHLIDQPYMYYYADDISAGMAKSTAIKGILLGVYIYSLGMFNNNKEVLT